MFIQNSIVSTRVKEAPLEEQATSLPFLTLRSFPLPIKTLHMYNHVVQKLIEKWEECRVGKGETEGREKDKRLPFLMDSYGRQEEISNLDHQPSLK